LHLLNLLFGAEPVFQFVTVFSATLLVEFVRATANLVFKSLGFGKRRGCAGSARTHVAFLVAAVRAWRGAASVRGTTGAVNYPIQVQW